MRGDDGEKEDIRAIGPGGHFGDWVPLGDGLLTGTVRALEDTEVVVVEAEDFQRIVSSMPVLKAYFQKIMASPRPGRTANNAETVSDDTAT